VSSTALGRVIAKPRAPIDLGDRWPHCSTASTPGSASASRRVAAPFEEYQRLESAAGVKRQLLYALLARLVERGEVV
jgi:hypothetical protein